MKRYWLMIKNDPMNVWWYIQGNLRMFLWLYLPIFLRKHIEEQFKYRFYSAKQCSENKSCLFCGCKTPHLYFSNKECKLNTIKDENVRFLLTGNKEKCYDKMLNKKNWDNFKKLKGLC